MADYEFYNPEHLSDKQYERVMRSFDRWCRRQEFKARIAGALAGFFESRACMLTMGVLAVGALILVGLLVLKAFSLG